MAEKITITAPFSQDSRSLGRIGRVGENISRQIVFDCTDTLADRPNANIVCVIQRPGDKQPYAAQLARVGETSKFKLVLTSTEVAAAGSVRFELRMVDGEEILKAAIYSGSVEASMSGLTDKPGEPLPDALNRLETAIAEVGKYAELKQQLDDICANGGDGISSTAKTLILNLFESAAYGNAQMQDKLTALKTEWNSSGDTTVVAVSSVTLDSSTLSLTAGNTATLTATVLPSNATNKTVTWSVSPTGYATLSATTGSSVTVTASAAGSCTITATAGGKSATCAVTVTAATSADGGIEGKTPVYKLPTAKTFTGVDGEWIDTGIKLFEDITNPQWTILFEVKGDNLLTATASTFCLFHCMEESGSYPGITASIWGGAGDLGINMYNSNGQVAHLSTLNGWKVKIALQINGATWTSKTNSGIGNYTDIAYALTTAVDKSLLIGAMQESDGTKKRFWEGTVHQFFVYDEAIDVATLESWVNA